MISEIETKSEQEVIEMLQEYGIRVIMKPVALLPDNLEGHLYEKQSIGFIETDIYSALRKIVIRNKIFGDPFS